MENNCEIWLLIILQYSLWITCVSGNRWWTLAEAKRDVRIVFNRTWVLHFRITVRAVPPAGLWAVCVPSDCAAGLVLVAEAEEDGALGSVPGVLKKGALKGNTIYFIQELSIVFRIVKVASQKNMKSFYWKLFRTCVTMMSPMRSVKREAFLVNAQNTTINWEKKSTHCCLPSRGHWGWCLKYWKKSQKAQK